MKHKMVSGLYVFDWETFNYNVNLIVFPPKVLEANIILSSLMSNVS